MELRENMYIRTNEGIRKILYEYEEGYELDKYLHYRYPEGHYLYKEDLEDGENDIVIKASDKLIDLVCESDYINGMKVKDNDGEYIVLDKIINNGSSLSYLEICESDIKTIITNEQIEQMSYKVGE